MFPTLELNNLMSAFDKAKHKWLTESGIFSDISGMKYSFALVEYLMRTSYCRSGLRNHILRVVGIQEKMLL